MKNIRNELMNHLHITKNFVCCDLYEMELANGHVYYYTDADIDIIYDGRLYKHNAIMIKRQQTKLHDRVVVDSMTVSINAARKDLVEGKALLSAAHDGTLDLARLQLKRCFYNNGLVVGVIGLFKGIVEVKQCGGLSLQLTVKSKVQGLSQEFPRRKYYPEGSYSTTSGSGTITSNGETDDYCLIAPFVPLKEVLL